MSAQGLVTLDASPELFGSRQEAAAVLACWLEVAKDRITVQTVDLVTDVAELPPEVDAARTFPDGLRRPRTTLVPWRRGRLRRLPTVDLDDPASLDAVATFAYWSIDVTVVLEGDRYVGFFSTADNGSWATYNLPVDDVELYLSAFPASVGRPSEWAAVLDLS